MALKQHYGPNQLNFSGKNGPQTTSYDHTPNQMNFPCTNGAKRTKCLKRTEFSLYSWTVKDFMLQTNCIFFDSYYT